MIQYKVLEVGCEPVVAREGDAGLDLKASRGIGIRPGEVVKVPLGITFRIDNPKGEVEIRGRSSIFKRGLLVHNGTIDASFNGKEVQALVANIGTHAEYIEEGERICQALGRSEVEALVLTTEPIDSRDSKEGFGSSGRM